MLTTPLVLVRAMSRKVSKVIDDLEAGTAGEDTLRTAEDTSGLACAAVGCCIWDVTTAPTSIAAIAIEKNEAIVRVLVFMALFSSLPLNVCNGRAAPSA